MTEVFIADACRTPMGRVGGQLAGVRPDDLAAHVIAALMDRNPTLAGTDIEDVVWGAVNQAGEDNRNVARMAGLLGGLGIETAGQTVNRLCGSGLQAIITASQALAAGWGDIMIAGGSESMSRAPFVITKPERAYGVGAPQIVDTVLGWRLVNPRMQAMYSPISMGETAEEVASKYGVTRADQDRFALTSHRRAISAQQGGRFDDEMVPIEAPVLPKKRTTAMIASDQGPRPNASMEALANLPPVFREGGTVTAGNSSPLNDGAAGVILATAAGLERAGLSPMARLVSAGVAGVHPDLMGMGPVPASEKALARAGLRVGDLDLVELNEAFAAQAVACRNELGIDPEILNVNGGAIALGHPLGCSGARILTTLVHELCKREGRHGLATMCIGVGQGISLVVERV
ncbi:MAG: thiolase family protein [Acidimicrobiia bacterium]|nr:thiolase family protein [Acidimicrobiia bacterium]MXY74720.1 thiolase family protein [Acidimicrobiia bacterium]MYA39204.1 thiolase family protein [Acidimicrobiia bacterium]MYH06743.1 thiolase family protein [Acidimicrobiia bacterium]MYK56190.1 thiolase family protein [Acidimicrobiia bacterium]